MDIEHKCIEACKQGVASAQKELYANYKNLWFTVCLRYMRRREDAADVLQNALIKIYGKLSSFDSRKGAFKPWSTKIVINECIMFQRKHWNRAAVASDQLEVLSPSQRASAISNLTLEEITKVIHTLPVGYRMVFNMYEIDGYSHREISELLGISIGTSKSQLAKAKANLKQKLSSLMREEIKMMIS